MLSKKEDFKVNYKTLKITMKSQYASEEIKRQEFWVLYIEYLTKKNILRTKEQLLSIINEAFSNIENNFAVLITYYLQKIKYYSPLYNSEGILEERDEPYLQLLDKNTLNFINQRRVNGFENKLCFSTIRKQNKSKDELLGQILEESKKKEEEKFNILKNEAVGANLNKNIDNNKIESNHGSKKNILNINIAK